MGLGMLSMGAAFSGGMQKAFGDEYQWGVEGVDQAFWVSGGAFGLMVLLGALRKPVD